jgi:hypothetical protein
MEFVVFAVIWFCSGMMAGANLTEAKRSKDLKEIKEICTQACSSSSH